MANRLAADRLRELLEYDPEGGQFRWRVGRQGVRANRNGAAGGPDGQGYTRIKVDGTYYGAHRLAWLYMTGDWPAGQIDHSDGDRGSNRWANLRDVSVRVNRQNMRRATSRSKTGLLGVYAPETPGNGFGAAIRDGGKSRRLGTFETPEEAHAAYVTAKREIHEGCTI